MKDFQRKSKPTLESLLSENQIITGKALIERYKNVEKEKALLQEAIKFEQQHRGAKS